MKKLLLLLIVGLLVNVSYGQELVKMSKEKCESVVFDMAKEAALKYGEKLYWDNSATIKVKKFMVLRDGVRKPTLVVDFINDFAREMYSISIVRVYIDPMTDKLFKIVYGANAEIEILSDEKNFDRKVVFPEEYRKKYLKYLVKNDKITSTEAKEMKEPEVFKDDFGSSVNHITLVKGAEQVSTWINERAKYPTDLAKAKIEGKVILSYRVTEDGSIADLKIVESPHDKLSYEVMQAAESFPKNYITPSYKNGKYFPYRGKVSIYFRVPEE